jgi:hypothetical protein
MKSCPKCQITYEDNSLEFCLEDGTRLVSSDNFSTEIPTVTHSNNPNPTIAKTVSLPFSDQAQGAGQATAKNPSAFPQVNQIKEKAIEKSNKVLEVIPIVMALAHNWWQWIYLNNQNYSSVTAFLLSPNFLVWFLLLIVGVVLGLISFKRTRNRGFAVAGLVIFAVNFILFLVPKR